MRHIYCTYCTYGSYSSHCSYCICGVLVGAAIVIASALYIAHREHLLARERRRAALVKPPEPPAP